jgi:predicted ATPase
MKQTPPGSQIDRISIQGFRSIKSCNLQLRGINILIGANGAGKSNFISVFSMIQQIFEKRLQNYVTYNGGPDALLWYGRKETEKLSVGIYFGNNGYGFDLKPTRDNQLMFEDEWFSWDMLNEKRSLGTGHLESRYESGTGTHIDEYVLAHVHQWKIYHFHDTSDTAKIKQINNINDNMALNQDGSNLAAYLFMMKILFPNNYQRIRKVIQLAAPFFDDFQLRPKPENTDRIELEWRSTHSERLFKASDMSDGTLRYICLATLLLQPTENIPETILIEEPEIGLHPYAIALLAALIKSVAIDKQIIVSTQSALFLSEFETKDIIIVDWKDDASYFHRLEDDEELQTWIAQDYSLGELWEKNIFGGRPQ